MSYLRFRDDEDESSVGGTVTSVLLGALAGFAVGMVVAQRVGGFSGLADRVRRRGAQPDAAEAGGAPVVADDFADYDEYDDEIEESEPTGLEERVLEAFRNDPILCERAIDIGSIGESTIELAGWVTTEEEAEHAVTIARGVPDVGTVVNRIAIGEEEDRVADHARRFAEGDEDHTEAHWEGRTVGTGRRRQGSSTEFDRHEDPKTELAEKWSRADAELHAADDIDSIAAERRQREKKVVKGDRTGGSPIAPTGVPKADHVAEPLEGV